ncbi:ankyrin repeat domain-containing protein [Endozoicomonas sp. YOMI1]|uniref:ankyrin repeat domain-containing protein n=1 Tax=Endozoicomonas sp. YOMI1 TaxID=2828739 RepID=UPI0021491BB3|nr:ankyrin repeat domain-containing protein [Endozoicomonas sp. YOMI1]
MNIFTAVGPVNRAYQQLTNEEICGASTQSTTGSSSVSPAPFIHHAHSSCIDPSQSLACQIPICNRAVETKTEPHCQTKSVTNDGVKAHGRTGQIKKADIKKATKDLHIAIKYTENLEDLTNDDIRALIEKGADATAKPKLSFKKTALHLAALRGNQRIIELLVNEAKADVNAIAESGMTVMECAYHNGSITPLIPFMVNAGFNINADCDGRGGTMLAHAAKKQNWELVEFLLAKGANPDDQIGDNGTALHLAVRLGRPDIIDMLMKHGADINARDKYKRRTVLHLVAESGQREILDKLLQHNADVNAQDNNGRTPLCLLNCANSQRDTVKYFMNTLIDNQADVNHRDRDGRTPLTILVNRLGHQSVIKYAIDTLIQHGADVNVRDEEGFTPLHFAAKNGQLELFNHLLEKGADKYARTNSGQMVLEIARSNGQNTAKMLESLDNAGLDVSEPCDSEGRTMVAYAAKNRQWKLVDSLISRGAEIDLWENEEYKYTSLHYAALTDQKDIVSELLKRNANANLPHIDGNSAIHFAVSDFNWHHQEDVTDRRDILVDLIENTKADINAQGYEGRTALHIAAHQGRVKLVAELLERKADFNILDNDKMTAYDRTFDRIKFGWDDPEGKQKVRELMKANKADVTGAEVRKAKAAEEKKAKAVARQRATSGLVHKFKELFVPKRKP